MAVMPEGATDERVLTIRSSGGDVMLVPRGEGIRSAIQRATELVKERGAFVPRQFENPDNAEVHRGWTRQEILSRY